LHPLFYFIADLYPWWGIPLALILLEAANRNRRRSERKQFLIKSIIAVVLIALGGGYFYLGREGLAASMQRLEQASRNLSR
jgi:hypothetical protein